MFRKLVLAGSAAWMAALLAAPMMIIVLIALAEPADGVPPYLLGFSLDNLLLVASDPLYRQALLRSLVMAGATTLACLLTGFPMATAIAGAAFRWRNPLLLAVMLPFWTGFLMRINAWIGLLADDGILVRTLHLHRLLYTDAALYIGMVYTYLPFMVLPLYSRLCRLDATLTEAAADLGAPPWRVFLRVNLPLAAPGAVAGGALVFVPALGEYVVPAFLGGPGTPLIGQVLWEEFFANRDWPTAAALTVWLLLLLVLLPAAAVWIARGLSPGGQHQQHSADQGAGSPD